jgi:hypothetical protein
LALTTQPDLGTRLKKEEAYIFSPPLDLHGLFKAEVYFTLVLSFISRSTWTQMERAVWEQEHVVSVVLFTHLLNQFSGTG